MLSRTAYPRLIGFIEPCLPSPARNPPAGDGWVHENQVGRLSLPGATRRRWRAASDPTRDRLDYPLSIHCRLRRGPGLRSCLIDGEVVICGEDGIPVFDRRQPQSEAVLFAFDLLELGGSERGHLPSWSAKPPGPCS
jgi:hypothetical protein